MAGPLSLSAFLTAVLFLYKITVILTAACGHSTNQSEATPSSSQIKPSSCVNTNNNCLCLPRTTEQLVDLYNKNNFNSDCVTLTKIEVPMQDDFSWTNLYVLTGKTSCFDAIHHSVCFNSSSVKLQCSWSQSWVDLGVDFFPRYISNVHCKGGDVCNAIASGPPQLEVLQRRGHCDDQGVDVWENVEVHQTINLFCNCVLNNWAVVCSVRC